MCCILTWESVRCIHKLIFAIVLLQNDYIIIISSELYGDRASFTSPTHRKRSIDWSDPQSKNGKHVRHVETSLNHLRSRISMNILRPKQPQRRMVCIYFYCCLRIPWIFSMVLQSFVSSWRIHIATAVPSFFIAFLNLDFVVAHAYNLIQFNYYLISQSRIFCSHIVTIN